MTKTHPTIPKDFIATCRQMMVPIAEGEDLDRIGDLVGIQRCPSVSDADFRKCILQQIKMNEESLPPKKSNRWLDIIKELND